MRPASNRLLVFVGREHPCPWPHDALEGLGEAPVEMGGTLSYFIEPNPSRCGVRSRYRDESHGLRFDVKQTP